MNKKRILLLTTGFGIGGAENVVLTLARNLDKNNYDIHVACLSEPFPGPLGKILIDENYKITLFKDSQKKSDYFTFLKLNKYLKENKIDICHSHNLPPLFDVAFIKYLNPNTKFVHTFHTSTFSLFSLKYKIMEFISSRIPDKLICVSHTQKKELIKNYKLNNKNISVVWNSLDNSKISTANADRDWPKVLRDKFIIGTISTFRSFKGIDLLIDAFKIIHKQMNNANLVVIGDGEQRGKLQELVKEYKLNESIFFLGWKTNTEWHLEQFDVFVQPSRLEAMSIVLLEAMRAGKSIIASNAGDNTLVIKNNKNGLIFDTGNSSQLAEKILLLYKNPSLRAELAQNARIDFNSIHTLEKFIASHSEIYSNL